MEDAELLEVLRLLRPVELDAGQVLFREGGPGQAMWVLGDGVEVSISATPPGAERPVLVARARSGQTVGEMALVDDGLRSATAVVTRGGPAHRIEAVDFHVLREAFHPAAFKVMRQICVELCGRLRAANDRVVPHRRADVPPSEVGSGRPCSDEVIEEFVPFRELPRVVKLALAQKLRLVEVPPQAVVFSEGDEASAAYFLLTGEVSVERRGRSIARLGPGTMFGLVAAIDGGRRSASCVTESAARFLRLSQPDFDALFSAGNRFAFQIVDLAAKQLVEHLRHTNALIAQGPPPGERGGLLPLELEVELDPSQAA